VKVETLRKPPWKNRIKSHEQVNKGGYAKIEKNRLSTRFAYPATFSSWIGFLSYFSAFLEAYEAAECVSCALEARQPVEGIA